MRRSAAGRTRRRPTSPTAARSIRSTGRADKAPANKAMKHTVLPGFRLTMGFTLVYLALIVLLPLLTLPARSATMTWEAFADDLRSARGRVVPAQHRRVARGGVDQRGVRVDRRVGARALQLSGTPHRRLARRSAVCLADRRRRH